MSALSQSSEVGLNGANAFALGAQSSNDPFEEQLWSSDQLLWGQLQSDPLEPDSAVPENVVQADFSSLSASPEAVRFRMNLRTHAQVAATATVVPRLKRISILELPRINLGTMLRPLDPNDDLLGEMLDEAWP
jgi:hypothetical protein